MILQLIHILIDIHALDLPSPDELARFTPYTRARVETIASDLTR